MTGEDTLPEVTAQIATFGQEVLGKGIVYGKDTPNFIANRIGCFGIAACFNYMQESGLSVEAMDAIFGEALGRPKSAVFRTADVVGIDTLGHVFQNVYDAATEDEQRDAFILPGFVKTLIESGATGQKTGAGFYKKTRVNGKKAILVLDVNTGEYVAASKPRFPCTGAARKAETVEAKIRAMVYGAEDDAASTAAWTVTAQSLIYSATRIPEIADDVVNIDAAMRWGFGWDLGPFQTWDAIGVAKSVERMEAQGLVVPAWVKSMLDAGRESFYARDENGNLTYWATEGKSVVIERSEKQLFLADVKAKTKVVERNISASLHDIGDGALLLEFHSRMNALDESIIGMYGNALDRLDAGEFKALVVGNEDPKAFCAGANLLMILMGAMQGDWKALEENINLLQQLMMRAKYSAAPVVTAPHGLTLGGGLEVTMHSAATVASGELYTGLVEVGVGLIPGAGGCKELVTRYTANLPAGATVDIDPLIQNAFQHIGTAQIATSAEEARGWGYLRPNDRVVLDLDSRLHTAKQVALGLANSGYQAPRKQTAIAAGPNCHAAISAYLNQMVAGGFVSAHDKVVGSKLAFVLTGGDVPEGTRVSEQHLLDLEREAFLSLCGEEKTIARIQHMLQKGRPLRN